jgi:protein-L-isoaspartate(D-aspartate) O-methyltransferase
MLRFITFILWFGFFIPEPSQAADDERLFDQQRNNMVTNQIEARGIKNKKILDVLLKVKRHLFVSPDIKSHAYEDSALPIDKNQTISQPYIVALMTELAQINPDGKVLEIGTGSGYQTAILAELAKNVFSMEIIGDLARQARARLSHLGYRNITIREGNGYAGWPEEAPFDAIIVTAAAKNVPAALVQQLKPGGRLVLPVGDIFQELFVITKNQNGSVDQKEIIPVRFVPMINENNKITK